MCGGGAFCLVWNKISVPPLLHSRESLVGSLGKDSRFETGCPRCFKLLPLFYVNELCMFANMHVPMSGMHVYIKAKTFLMYKWWWGICSWLASAPGNQRHEIPWNRSHLCLWATSVGAGSHTHLLQEQSSILTTNPGLQFLESNIIVFKTIFESWWFSSLLRQGLPALCCCGVYSRLGDPQTCRSVLHPHRAIGVLGYKCVPLPPAVFIAWTVRSQCRVLASPVELVFEAFCL